MFSRVVHYFKRGIQNIQRLQLLPRVRRRRPKSHFITLFIFIFDTLELIFCFDGMEWRIGGFEFNPFSEKWRERVVMAKSSVEIQTRGATIDKSGICYIVKELVGFVLYMHQQIPHTLQQLETEFDGMKLEHERLVGKSTETEAQFKPSSRRILMGKLREIKREFKKVEKLITSISNLLTAVQTIVHNVPEVQVVLLALGASSTRPQHVYEICFVCEGSVPEDVENCPQMGKKVKADVLSKKIIRALVSNGAGCADSCSAPTKLFLLIQAPANISLPQDFLPRRDYAYSKKVDPCRIHVRSSYGNGKQERSNEFYQADRSTDADPQNVKRHMHDIIWFQCKHNVQGLANPGNQC